MQYKDIIMTLIAVLAFLISGVLVYWRENRKSFQEKIFDQKFAAYKDIIEQYCIYYRDMYELLEKFQDFEGEGIEWQSIFSKEYSNYHKRIELLENLYFKNLLILPENELFKLSKLESLASGHLTNHFHHGTDFPHNSYERLGNEIFSFAEGARKELSVDILNFTLSKRLSQQFYPVSFPKNKSSNK